MKKLLLLLLLPFAFLIGSCHHDKDHSGNTTTLTNLHPPVSGSDSIKFTADTSHLHLLMFSPLGGKNHVIVRDMTGGNNIFDGLVSGNDQNITGFIAGNNYAIICYSGLASTNFISASSSYTNSGAIPMPFAGYTQYFNNSGTAGPTDGVVVILMEGD